MVVRKPTYKKWWLDFQGIYIYIHRYIISNIVISKDPSVLLVPSPVQDQHGKDHARLSLSHVQLHNGTRILNELLRYLQKGMVSPESVFEAKTSSNEDTSRFKMVVERNPASSWYCKDLSQLVHDLFFMNSELYRTTQDSLAERLKVLVFTRKPVISWWKSGIQVAYSIDSSSLRFKYVV